MRHKRSERRCAVSAATAAQIACCPQSTGVGSDKATGTLRRAAPHTIRHGMRVRVCIGEGAFGAPVIKRASGRERGSLTLAAGGGGSAQVASRVLRSDALTRAGRCRADAEGSRAPRRVQLGAAGTRRVGREGVAAASRRKGRAGGGGTRKEAAAPTQAQDVQIAISAGQSYDGGRRSPGQKLSRPRRGRQQ
eukprot:6179938-Pleurochrysis_carterae.AAC.2